jgi:outer membrane protein
MKKLLFATSLLTAVACTGMAYAQSSDAPVGKAAGTFMIRGRLIGVIPESRDSSISGAINGGSVGVSATPAPEADFSYFITDNIAMELIAATTKHELFADNNAALMGLGLGNHYKVGHTWVLPPTLLLQYHFMPHSQFSPYVGVGLNVTFFYGSGGDGVVSRVAMSNNVGPAIQAGFDYNFSGRWFANVDVKQIFLNTEATLSTPLGSIKAKTALDPLVVGLGFGYRF